MALHFLDTSALAKRYVPEAGSQWIARLIESDEIAVSELVFVEMSSVLARRVREKAIENQLAQDAFQLFLTDALGYMVIDLSRGLVLDAARLLLETEPAIRLRSLDALQLASARVAFTRARNVSRQEGKFVSSDRVLLEMAGRIGLSAINPEDVGA